MARAVTFATVLLGLWIASCAVRPSREEVQQLLETEVAPRDARPIAEASRSRNLEPALREAAPVEAGAAFLAGESAEYPHCDGLPHNGSHVIDTARIFSTSCTWHGNPGLQVTLKETLTFRGNLVLKGEIQIMGEQELDGPCINVSGKMTVIAANASFVGCRNRMKDGEGGALFIQRDLIVSNSGVKFENCRASEGGGLYTFGSFLQDAESMVTFENCTAFSGGGAHVNENFTQGRNSSAIFRSCSASKHGGGLYAGNLFTGGSFLQEAESTATFENCTSGRDGGGARVKTFTQGAKSSAIFRSCSTASFGGGLYTLGSFSQEAESTVTFENCTSASSDSSGGGAAIMKTATQGRKSSAIFRSCSASIGGCIYTGGSFSQEAESTVTFENCTAFGLFGSGGGGARVSENFTQGAKSSAIFRSCSASKGGGCLYTAGSFLQEAESTVTFENCTAFGRDGGGARVKTFTQGAKSSAIFRSCSASKGGGCLYTVGSFSQAEECTVIFENCTGSGGGGARVNESFTQGRNSSAIFRSCSASEYGGGLSTGGSFSQAEECTVIFENCTGSGGGGARVSENFTQGRNSSAIFRSCSASEYGGGLYAGGSFSQAEESAVTFENCTGSGGGGARVNENFTQGRNSSAIFRSCSASFGDGGGVATKVLNGNGSMHFKACRARTGGGLSITGGTVRHDGSLAFEECNASNTGGGLYMVGGQGLFGKLLFDRCDADVAAAALAAIAANGTEAELRLEELSLLRDSEGNGDDIAVAGLLKLGAVHLSTESSSGIYIAAHNLSLEDVMDCTNTSACTFYANAATRAGFLCPLGTGWVDLEAWHGFGCLACKPGDTQVLNVTSRPCSQCPEGASKCLASELKMEPGLMVELQDIKRSFHCPNEAACPGGDVSQGRVHLAMCAAGYRGQGCTNCSDEHAMADSSVFSCTACSKDRRVQAVQWITLLSQRTFLFAIGALSAFGAKKAGDLKQSSIYLNQLMAFATISNTILAAVLQTQTAKDIKSDAANFFFNAAMHTAETASGQGSLRSASSQCLLSYLGYEKTLWGTHLLDVVVAAGLISSLSLMKDSRVALIAGMNCFLPAIAADFGKYLVCYRLRRDDASGLQGLHCPFLPGSAGLAGATQVAGGLILFMAAALWTWLSLSRSDEDPKPSHVVFLTSKYQRSYALFETERLIRKTLFTFIGALLPISSSPALQMGCLGLVVWVSLFLYCRYQPYHTPEWNWIEICLLFTSMLMILSVSTLLANEFHWGHSVPTQQSIIFATAAVAAMASAIMSFRVMQELIREQRQPSN